jgi:hypothetical protein
MCVFVCCVLFVYFLCIVLRFKSYKWRRGPRLPVVIQWGSAEVRRLRTAALDNTIDPLHYYCMSYSVLTYRPISLSCAYHTDVKIFLINLSNQPNEMKRGYVKT